MPLIDKSLLNPTLYTRLLSHWFAPLPQTASLAPPPLMKKWFGMSHPDDKHTFDTSCRTLFGPALDSLSPTNYPLTGNNNTTEKDIANPLIETLSTPREALALILLLDQIPRNIHRKNQSLIYTHYDPLARSVLKTLLSLPSPPSSSTPPSSATTTPLKTRPDHHPSLKLLPIYRSWLYLPLMHSESPADHALYTTLLSSLRSDVESSWEPSTTEPGTEGEEEKKEDVLALLDEYARFEEKHAVIIRRFGRYPHRNVWLGRETTAEEKEFLEGGGDTFGN